MRAAAGIRSRTDAMNIAESLLAASFICASGVSIIFSVCQGLFLPGLFTVAGDDMVAQDGTRQDSECVDGEYSILRQSAECVQNIPHRH